MGNSKLAFLVFLVGFAVAGIGCSEARFSSGDPAAQAGKSGDGLGDGSAAEDTLTLDEIAEDGVIDDNEEAVLDDNDCSKNNRERKSLVCHFPCGNVGNAHTICIGRPALAAHLHRHGDGDDVDYVGPCRVEDGTGMENVEEE